MGKPVERIFNFILRKAESEPIETQISLYRDLAEIAPTEAAAKELRKLATDLAQITRRSRQLQLDLFSK